LKTFVCDKPAKAIGSAREIEALRFSKIVLEILFISTSFDKRRGHAIVYCARHETKRRAEAVGRFRTANSRAFGSVLHGTGQDGSDLGLLVDALPGATLFEHVDADVCRFAIEVLGKGTPCKRRCRRCRSNCPSFAAASMIIEQPHSTIKRKSNACPQDL
jgi:hypothetical protein